MEDLVAQSADAKEFRAETVRRSSEGVIVKARTHITLLSKASWPVFGRGTTWDSHRASFSQAFAMHCV
ncbi:hypothetical protein ACFXB3_10235 [Streptomyces sp. NPDC059447]|uniref:hypothetical protein n=1 Tax=Streptomyces sp. NPDC059447 TaxID=3346834 RepID=UPI0036B9C6B7